MGTLGNGPRERERYSSQPWDKDAKGPRQLAFDANSNLILLR